MCGCLVDESMSISCNLSYNIQLSRVIGDDRSGPFAADSSRLRLAVGRTDRERHRYRFLLVFLAFVFFGSGFAGFGLWNCRSILFDDAGRARVCSNESWITSKSRRNSCCLTKLHLDRLPFVTRFEGLFFVDSVDVGARDQLVITKDSFIAPQNDAAVGDQQVLQWNLEHFADFLLQFGNRVP